MDWHYGADDFPDELDEKSGGIHIGMFLAWAINNDLIGEFHTTESIESISKVKLRQITGTEFLQQECDERLWEEDLNQEGNEFAKFYYESNIYYSDYESILSNGLSTLYHVKDSWENYDKLSIKLNEQFNIWQASKNKKWWQFWK